MGLEPHKKGSAPKKQVDFSYQLNEQTKKFRLAFEQFHAARDEKSKEHLLGLMDENLKKMDEFGKSCPKRGVRKQEVLLSKDAQTYFQDQSEENYKKLQQDITTLLEANQL